MSDPQAPRRPSPGDLDPEQLDSDVLAPEDVALVEADPTDPASPAHPAHPEHQTFRERWDDFVDRLEDAAIAAEYATGPRESSEEEARAGVFKRMARITLGTIVTLIGIAALPLPGPGWLIIAGGLSILARDIAWADRALRYVRKKVPGVPEDGKIPRSSLVTIGVISLAAVSASLWWSFARGSDEIQAGDYTVTEFQPLADSTPTELSAAVISLDDTGPVTIAVDGCEPIEISVTERSRETFTLGDASGSCETASVLISALAGSTVDLGYDTDGILAWVLDDDFLTGLSNDAVTVDLDRS